MFSFVYERPVILRVSNFFSTHASGVGKNEKALFLSHRCDRHWGDWSRHSTDSLCFIKHSTCKLILLQNLTLWSSQTNNPEGRILIPCAPFLSSKPTYPGELSHILLGYLISKMAHVCCIHKETIAPAFPKNNDISLEERWERLQSSFWPWYYYKLAHPKALQMDSSTWHLTRNYLLVEVTINRKYLLLFFSHSRSFGCYRKRLDLILHLSSFLSCVLLPWEGKYLK